MATPTFLFINGLSPKLMVYKLIDTQILKIKLICITVQNLKFELSFHII